MRKEIILLLLKPFDHIVRIDQEYVDAFYSKNCDMSRATKVGKFENSGQHSRFKL